MMRGEDNEGWTCFGTIKDECATVLTSFLMRGEDNEGSMCLEKNKGQGIDVSPVPVQRVRHLVLHLYGRNTKCHTSSG